MFLEDGLTLDDLSAFAASELFAPRLRLYELQFDETPSSSYFLLKDLASFARVWDRNLKEQGFVEAAWVEAQRRTAAG